MVPSTFLRSKPARCLPVLLATLLFAGCGTHTQDQSTAFMQGTSQANSSFYLQQMQQSTNDSKTNWQLLAIRALLQEGKKQQAIDLFNQLPANLNSTQAREQSLLAVEVKLAQNDYQAARNLLAKIDPTNLEQPQQARYWQAQIDASQGKPSLTLLRALIAQQPLLSDAKQRQKNIDATWQALTSMPQDQANALVINADENILQGWLDLQRMWFDNRNDPTLLKAGVKDWQTRYPQNPGAKMLPTALVNMQNYKPASINKIALFLPLNGQASIFGRTIQQGFEAAKEIAAAIDRLDKSGEVDTIIVARGGGSREDLWVFNAEIIARAAYRCKTPLISAIGHEIDFTILDFVADQRAPTPSAAAELAVPDRAELARKLYNLEQNIQNIMQNQLKICYNELMQAEQTLSPEAVRTPLTARRQSLAARQEQLQQAMQQKLRNKKEQLGHAAALAGSLSPYQVLARGYAMLYDKNKKLCTADSLRAGDTVTVRGAAKLAHCTVISVEEQDESTQNL